MLVMRPAFVARYKCGMREAKTVTITVRVRPSTKAALERLMARLDRSQAGVIEHLIREADRDSPPPAE